MTKSEKAAQGQLVAYNAKDVEAFISWYSEDVIAYDLDTGTTLFTNKAEMRPKYETLFKNVNLHCDVTNRMVLGSVVIDYEHIIRNAEGETFDAIAIYDINEEGLIQYVRFTRGRL